MTDELINELLKERTEKKEIIINKVETVEISNEDDLELFIDSKLDYVLKNYLLYNFEDYLMTKILNEKGVLEL